MRKHSFVPALAVVALLAVIASASGVEAGSKTFNGQFTGTSTSVPVDIFGTSCVTLGGITTCMPTSTLNLQSGSSTGGPANGPFTDQAIGQSMPVPGTGCSFLPAGTECTVAGLTPNGGCLYTGVPASGGVGGAGATVDSSGDLAAYYVIGGSLCLDGATLKFSGTTTNTCWGGTGKNAGCFGTTNWTGTFSGAILISDPAGSGFSWFSGTFTGTEAK